MVPSRSKSLSRWQIIGLPTSDGLCVTSSYLYLNSVHTINIFSACMANFAFKMCCHVRENGFQSAGHEYDVAFQFLRIVETFCNGSWPSRISKQRCSKGGKNSKKMFYLNKTVYSNRFFFVLFLNIMFLISEQLFKL